MLTVWYHAITSAFRVSRGLALSVNSTGGGIAAMCGPFVANFLIEAQGWRMAFIVMGLGCGCFVASLCYFALRERVESSLPSRHDARPTDDQPVAVGVTVSEGLRSFAFAKIMTAIFFAYLLSTCLTVHQISILTDGGVPRDTAIATASAYGVALIIGKISSGIAVDRFPARFVGAICLTLFLLCFAILRFPGEAITARVVAIALFGLSTGGLAPLIPNLISRYFGLRSFGRLFGVGVSIISIAGAVGPLFGGVIYDAFKSYNLLLTLAMPMLFLGIIFLLSLGEYPAFSDEHAGPIG
jgi:MFS family permease